MKFIMKRSPLFCKIMFSLSNLTNASIHTSPNQTIDHYGTGNDGDNTSGLLLKIRHQQFIQIVFLK
jgi:hypothetical protein